MLLQIIGWIRIIMICLVLAAGYATRLYPLTENFPKPLLEIGGKSILDHILEDVDATTNVSKYVIVTNHKFISHFEKWKAHCNLTREVVLVDDGSMCNENRLGAVKDLSLAIHEVGIDDDLMVLAGDNLLDFSLSSFATYFEKKQASCVMRHYEESLEKLRKTGVAVIDDTDRIESMEEKPQEPKSHWAIPPFYIYAKQDLALIDQALENGCSADAPGGLVMWLCQQYPVYAMEMPGKRYDIGTKKDYDEINQNWK